MKVLLIGCVVGLLALAPVSAVAQGASGSKPAASQKTQNADGTVSAVSASSLTIKGAKEEMTFVIDGKTRVIGRGMSTKTAELKKDEKPSVITEFIKVGDQVTVQYHDLGATKHAASVRVRTPKK